jgi:hypothetical protein
LLVPAVQEERPVFSAYDSFVVNFSQPFRCEMEKDPLFWAFDPMVHPERVESWRCLLWRLNPNLDVLLLGVAFWDYQKKHFRDGND